MNIEKLKAVRLALMSANRDLLEGEFDNEIQMLTEVIESTEAPVAVYRAGQVKGEPFHVEFFKKIDDDEALLYTTKPAVQKGWVGLTEKDYIEVTVQHFGKNGVRWFEDSLPNFVKSVESKLQEKNQ